MPVVQVWEGILLVRVIGMLDSARTQQLMERQFGERRTQVAATLASKAGVNHRPVYFQDLRSWSNTTRSRR